MKNPRAQNYSSSNSPARREFLVKSTAWITGTVTASALGISRLFGHTAHEVNISDVISSFENQPEDFQPSGMIDDIESFEIIDCHLHSPSEQGERWQWYKVTNDFDDFVRYLDKTGVHRGIINSQRSYDAKPEEFVAGNREIARYVEKYKGRFMGACIVNPQYIEEALREIEECRNQFGFVWVGELCNYMVPYQYTIKEFDTLVNHVSRLKMVLALHTEQGEMDYIAQKFPQATITFAHFGDDHEYQDIFKRIDIVAKNPNFYLDTSGYGHDRVGILEYAVRTIGPDRILFGSDFSINDPGTVIARIKNSFLTMEQKQKILSGNLQSLLKKVCS